jgi:hypothetical protein
MADTTTSTTPQNTKKAHHSKLNGAPTRRHILELRRRAFVAGDWFDRFTTQRSRQAEILRMSLARGTSKNELDIVERILDSAEAWRVKDLEIEDRFDAYLKRLFKRLDIVLDRTVDLEQFASADPANHAIITGVVSGYPSAQEAATIDAAVKAFKEMFGDMSTVVTPPATPNAGLKLVNGFGQRNGAGMNRQRRQTHSGLTAVS